jgi:hypothetical protein
LLLKVTELKPNIFNTLGERHMQYVTSVERIGIEKGVRQGLLEAIAFTQSKPAH